MRKLIFWTLTSVLVLILGTATFFWVRSYDYSDQMTVRLGTPGVSVWTSDRGRLGVLMLGPQPMGERWVMDWRTNPGPSDNTPTLDALCVENGLGFGIAYEVNISGLEQPAVAGVSAEPTFAPRRLVAPFWSLAAASGGLLLLWCLTYGVRLYRIDHGLCGKCSFDVSQSSHFCPKCGKAIPKRTWSGDTRPRRRMVATPQAAR
ncbi:MAG: zinc ribbon domain-containing protein [Planctomycetota bacterium]